MTDQIQVTLESADGKTTGTLENLEKAVATLAAKMNKPKKGAIPVDIFDTKLYKTACKRLGDKEAKEFVEKSTDDLKMVLAENVLRKDDLSSKLKENVEYAKAKDIVQTLEGGMKDTMKDSNLVAKLAKAVLKARK